MCAKKSQVDRSFNTFISELKGDKTGSVILMYGPEQYLVRWAVDMIRKKYVNPAVEEMDYVVIEDENADPYSIIEVCETFSMLSDKRVVWVRNYKPLTSKNTPKGFDGESLEKLADYLKNINPKTVVVFSAEEVASKEVIVDTIKKSGTYYDFVQLSDRELRSFAAKRFRNEGVEISSYLMSQLIKATGYGNKESDYRLYNFENDIRKVIAHSSGNVVAEEDIREAVSGDNDTFIFDLIDGISGNNKKQAFQVLHNRLQVDAYDTQRIIGTIASQLELMYEVKEFQESEDGPGTAEEISKYTKANVYRVRNIMRYDNRYTLEKLRSMLAGIYRTHISIVTGVMGAQMALELFVAEI